MITDTLLGMLAGLLGWIDSVRPAWELHLPAGVSDLVATMFAYNDVLPVSELFTIIGGVATLTAAMLGFKWSIKVVDWIADVLP